MSGMLGVCRDDVVHLMSDGAVYTEDRVLLCVMPKVIQIGSLNAAFVHRGSTFAMDHLRFAAAQVATFDELVDNLADVLEDFDRRMATWAHVDNEILIGGWSDIHGRPRLLFRATHGRMAGVEPGNVYEVSGFVTGDQSELASRIATFSVADGVEIMKAARDHKEQGGTDIGGAVYHMQISAAGVSPIARVFEWPEYDEVQRISLAQEASQAAE